MKKPQVKWIGIDYGAKLSGNTAVVWENNNDLHCAQSEKASDTDLWLSRLVKELNPEKIFIDAPLSLPSVYSSKGNDYFYRQCDRECKAMSPMFIGGLTARAMKLSHSLSGYNWIETYPGYLAREVLELDQLYKKRKPFNPEILHKLDLQYEIKDSLISNWHRFDALLAWFSGWRYHNEDHISLGDANEGLIIV